jgi:predicted ATPase/DNA-binding CsgD family transcriptional regulator
MKAQSPPIPSDLTSFVGRQNEISDIIRLIQTSRLVTLTGTAGCGKTRLAKRAAAEVKQEYSDGVYWVELVSLVQPDHVLQSVGRILQVGEQPGQSWTEALVDVLQSKQLLIVLDNCEHLLTTCRQLSEALLLAPGVKILTTSREALGAPGEMRYPVHPLALPPDGFPALQAHLFDAVRLFIERARAILPDFNLTKENADAVAHICRKLDGIPLAIELASARVNVLAVEQIAAWLDDQFDFPEPSTNVIPSHHRSLRAAINWSYELLTPPEQALFLRLSVFAGGCSLSAMETVCSGDGVERDHMLELLSSLVDKSLVVAQTLQGSEARYHLLETIRQYAKEKLILARDWSVLRDRHLNYFLLITGEAHPNLGGQDQHVWLNWLDGEYDNIRAALKWSLESSQTESGLRIANAIYPFWTIRDYVEEGLKWMEQLLAQVDKTISPVVHANALAYATYLAGFRGNIPEQIRYSRAARAIAGAVGDDDKPALVWALSAEAYGARAAGDYQTEFEINKRIIQLHREIDNRYLLGIVLSTSSFTAMSLGEYEEARSMLDEALLILGEVGNPYRIAMALNFSGDLARCERNYSQAQAPYEESIALLRDLDAPRDLASALQNLGHTYLHLEEAERAYDLFNQSIEIQIVQRNTPGIAECLIGFAALAIRNSLHGIGVRLLAAAVNIGGSRVSSAWAATRIEYEYYLALAQAGLTGKEFQMEESFGRSLSVEHAIEHARNLPSRVAAAKNTRKKTHGLTLREREVVSMIGQGKSNGEIAAELMVSKRTIETHIANIRSKLGFTKRAQIVRWAIESGLVN